MPPRRVQRKETTPEPEPEQQALTSNHHFLRTNVKWAAVCQYIVTFFPAIGIPEFTVQVRLLPLALLHPWIWWSSLWWRGVCWLGPLGTFAPPKHFDAPFLTFVYVPVPIPIDDALKSSAPTVAPSYRVFTWHFYFQRRPQLSRARSDAFGTSYLRFSKMTWPTRHLISYQSSCTRCCTLRP